MCADTTALARRSADTRNLLAAVNSARIAGFLLVSILRPSDPAPTDSGLGVSLF